MFKGFTYFVKFAWKRNKMFLISEFIDEIFKSLLPLVSIILPKFIIDGITENRGIKYIGGFIILYISVNLFANIIMGILMYTTNTARNKLSYDVDEYLSENISQSDYEIIESDTFLQKQRMAEVYLRNGRPFGSIYTDSVRIIGSILRFVGIISIIATLSIWVVLMLTAIILFNSFIKSRFNGKFYKINELMEKTWRNSRYIKNIMEGREWGKEVRINNLTNKMLKKYKFYNKISFKAGHKNRIYALFLLMVKGITGFFQEGIVYFYLVIQAINGTISIGSFTMYISAISDFSWAMFDVMNNIIELRRIDLSYKDFDEYINLPQKMREGKRLSVNNPSDKHSIEFKDVWFKYPSSEKYILKNINIKIEAGEKLSVVGENGAGKTTFIKLLTRLYDPTKGEILFDGVDIKDLDYDEYMKALSVVFQDFRLFAFSIKENVTLKDNDEVSDEEVLKILEKSGLSENMKKFDKGIHTTVYKEFDDEGVELSGGEGQKLSIARALYKNGGIVVLDEPTAALDPRSEYEIYMRFNELIQEKTAIFISHRLSSSRFCDKVAVFENGEIKEYGTHDTLMNENGIYAELYNKQAQFYVDVE